MHGDSPFTRMTRWSTILIVGGMYEYATAIVKEVREQSDKVEVHCVKQKL